MGRAKPPSLRSEQPELPSDQAAAKILPKSFSGTSSTHQTPASLQEYEEPITRERWRAERFDLLSAEFAIAPSDLPTFHRLLADAARESAPLIRPWLIVRRLFGLIPIIPPSHISEDDLRSWSRSELCAQLGINDAALRMELEAVRALWRTHAETRARSEQGENVERAGRTSLPGDGLTFPEDDILRRYGFPDSMFSLEGRGQEENRTEKTMFAAKVRDWSKMLEHKMAGTLARQALLNELKLHRGEIEIMKINTATSIGKKDYAAAIKLQQDLEETYREQLEMLDGIFPWMGRVSGEKNVLGVFSDLVDGYKEYYANGSNKLFDGLMTAMEIQVSLRQSVQAPEPRYRAGLVAHINSARAGLWDPNWKPHFTSAQLRKLDEAFQAAAAAAADAMGEKPVDLLSEDSKTGEYEALHAPDLQGEKSGKLEGVKT